MNFDPLHNHPVSSVANSTCGFNEDCNANLNQTSRRSGSELAVRTKPEGPSHVLVLVSEQDISFVAKGVIGFNEEC